MGRNTELFTPSIVPDIVRPVQCQSYGKVTTNCIVWERYGCSVWEERRSCSNCSLAINEAYQMKSRIRSRGYRIYGDLRVFGRDNQTVFGFGDDRRGGGLVFVKNILEATSCFRDKEGQMWDRMMIEWNMPGGKLSIQTMQEIMDLRGKEMLLFGKRGGIGPMIYSRS